MNYKTLWHTHRHTLLRNTKITSKYDGTKPSKMNQRINSNDSKRFWLVREIYNFTVEIISVVIDFGIEMTAIVKSRYYYMTKNVAEKADDTACCNIYQTKSSWGLKMYSSNEVT